MIALIQSRLRERIQAGAAARQRGFITMQVLALTVLLLVAAAGLVGVAQATIHTSREGQSFTQARRALDYAQSNMEAQFAGGLIPIYTNGTTLFANSDAEGYEVRETYEWESTPANATVEIRTTIDGAGNTPDTIEKASIPVRGTLVASRDTVSSATGSSISYGIPAGPRQPGTMVSAFATGLWGSAVSTAAGTSTIVGNVYAGSKPGTWGIFGGTISNAAQARTVAFADGITSPTNAAAFNRSRFNAYMDTRISDQLMSNIRSNADCADYRSADYTYFYNALHTYQCRKGPGSGYNTVTSTLTGVSTQVFKGDLALRGDVSTGPNGELHLYVDGNVTLGDSATPGTRTYNKVFIYAPNGTCRAAAGTIVNLTGSLACKTVILDQGTANRVNWSMPREQGNAEPYTLNTSDPSGNYRAVDVPKVIHYFERPGFVDQWSQ